MAYKCIKCGHIFDEGEEKRWKESRGEFWGFPCSEEMSGCPICGGEYEETMRCKICHGEFVESELYGGVCNDCIDDYRNNFKTCRKISRGEETVISINSLLASLFDVGTIEAILYSYIENKIPNADCSEFIDSDIIWFGEKLAEEVTKNEDAKR